MDHPHFKERDAFVRRCILEVLSSSDNFCKTTTTTTTNSSSSNMMLETVVTRATTDASSQVVISGLKLLSVIIASSNNTHPPTHSHETLWRNIVCPLLSHSCSKVREHALLVLGTLSHVTLDRTLAQAFSTEVVEMTESKKRHRALVKSYENVRMVAEGHDTDTVPNSSSDDIRELDPIVSCLSFVLDDEHPKVRCQAIRTIVQLVAPHIAISGVTDFHTRQASLRATALVEPFVLDMVHDDSEEVRCEALRALRKIGSPSSHAAACSLLPCLREQAVVVRHVVLLALGSTDLSRWTSTTDTAELALIPNVLMQHSVAADLPAVCMAAARLGTINKELLAQSWGQHIAATVVGNNLTELSSVHPALVVLLANLDLVPVKSALAAFPHLKDFLPPIEKELAALSSTTTTPLCTLVCGKATKTPFFLPARVTMVATISTPSPKAPVLSLLGVAVGESGAIALSTLGPKVRSLQSGAWHLTWAVDIEPQPQYPTLPVVLLQRTSSQDSDFHETGAVLASSAVVFL
eukprot:PhM_4_TR5396/c0_g1_i1/m.65299